MRLPYYKQRLWAAASGIHGCCAYTPTGLNTIVFWVSVLRNTHSPYKRFAPKTSGTWKYPDTYLKEVDSGGYLPEQPPQILPEYSMAITG
jgi:hypothetical protein